MSLEPVGEAAVCKTAKAGSVPAGDSSDRAAPAMFKRRRDGEGRVAVNASSVTALGVRLSSLPPYGECRRGDGNQL